VKATAIPSSSRRAVAERDRGLCRCCGRWCDPPHLHHVVYRSQERNNHAPENLVSLCWRCHKIAHAHPNVMRPALQEVLTLPGTTAAQWLRWQGQDLSELSRGLV
jgi:5-methylcytosine-specific restriction endonuclease McrA